MDAAVNTGRLPLNTRPCVTERLKLLGAGGYRCTLFAEVIVLVLGVYMVEKCAAGDLS